MFAQKLINDVLFEAEMKTLSRSFKVIDSREPQYHFGAAGEREHYGWQHHISSQIDQYQHIPQQIGQQQQMPQRNPNSPFETVRSGAISSGLIDYFTNFN